MGGPGASVLLRHTLTKQQENELDFWLRSITRHLEQTRGGYKFWLNDDAFPGTVSRCLFYLSIEETTTYWDDDEQRQVQALLGYLPQQSVGASSGCNQDEDHTTLGQLVLHLAEVYDGLIDMGGAITPPLKPVNRARLEEWLAEPPERARERRAYVQARLKALEATLPPGQTMLDLLKVQHLDPNSPLKVIWAEAEAQFGPVIPPELSVSARMPPLEEIHTHVTAMPGIVYEIEYTAAAGHRCVSHIVDVAFFRAWMAHPHFYMVK